MITWKDQLTVITPLLRVSLGGDKLALALALPDSGQKQLQLLSPGRVPRIGMTKSTSMVAGE